MKPVTLAKIAKGSIITFSLIGIIICGFWYPFSISLTTIGITDTAPTSQQIVRFWVQLIFYWVVSVPCFFVLILFWKISTAIRYDSVFDNRVSNQIKRCAIILFSDVVVFFVGNSIFAIWKWNSFLLVHFIIGIIGLLFAGFLVILSYYVKKAANLQEMVDGTI